MSPAHIDAYAELLEQYGAEAVKAGLDDITSGKVERDDRFVPNALEISRRAAMWRDIFDAARTPPAPLHNGLVEMDFGHGAVDMRGLTNEQQDTIIAARGMVGGRNAATLSRGELLEALGGKALPRQVRPSLQRMRG